MAAGEVSVGESATLAPLRLASSVVGFARPKSRTFTVPSSVILMLAGFRSR